MSALNDLWDKEVTELSKEIKKLKEDNKRLDKENQALYESINCNDDNMLARRYSNLQKELDKKDKVIDLIITDYLNLSKERMSKEEFKKWYFDLVGIKKVEEEK